MAVNYLFISLLFFLLSSLNLLWWTKLSLMKVISHTFTGDDTFGKGNALHHAMEFLMESRLTVSLVANFVISLFILLALSVKSLFFGKLFISESRKLIERLINYVIYKGGFLPLVVPPTIFQASLWLTWLFVVCSLKMFQALGRDRLERLNTSPSILPWEYFRVFLVLPFVLAVDMLWMRLCSATYRALGAPMPLFIFFEPLSILFETLQAIFVHGFQLLEIWIHHSSTNVTCFKTSTIFGISSPGYLTEWKGVVVQNLGFYLEILTLLMALGHYVDIWWLHGMSFHFIDVVLFLNIRAVMSVIVKRVRGFIRMRRSLGTLKDSFPDATKEDLKSYNDECAICKEPMSKAKKLCCTHLFHLSCLRSWLDQGSSELYSCPTCRKPFSMPTTDVRNPNSWDFSDAGGLDVEMDVESDHPNGVWRGTQEDWGGSGGAAGSSETVGLGRVQMMVRRLAAVGETYAQNAPGDGAWNLFPAAASASASGQPAGPSGYAGGRQGGFRPDDDVASLLAMVETVREVLPDVPDHQILQDLRRTNSAMVTVNNLIQM